jgi:hypothetical protein
MPDDPDDVQALQAENARLRQQLLEAQEQRRETEAENERLHEQLAARDRTNERLCAYANRGWARVATLAARARRLLRLAKHWREHTPKLPLPDHTKEVMIARYVLLGGRERGRGTGAAEQVAEEFGVSPSTVNRLIAEFKDRKGPSKAGAERISRSYRQRYGE